MTFTRAYSTHSVVVVVLGKTLLKKSLFTLIHTGLHVSTCLSFNTFQHVSTRLNKFTTTLDKFQHV